jgi:hypothetical protein
MKTWHDPEVQRGQDLRAQRRTRWLLLTAAAATALILYQFPLIKVSILQHCSTRGRNGDVVSPQWEDFNWDAVSGSAFLSALDPVSAYSRRRLDATSRVPCWCIRLVWHPSRYIYHTVECHPLLNGAVELCTWGASTPPSVLCLFDEAGVHRDLSALASRQNTQRLHAVTDFEPDKRN